MNFEFAEKINLALESLDISQALKIATLELQKIPATDFHSILKITLTKQATAVADWINKFYQSVCRKKKVEALYFEINEFDINTDMWFIHGFSYSQDVGRDIEDMDWLCDYNSDSETEINAVFEIGETRLLQKAFSEVEEKEENGE